MLIQSKRLDTGVITDRRALLRGVGTVGLSAAAIAVLGGCESMAASKSAREADVEILNVALGLEHEAINAYQLGAESGLLQDPVLKTAVMFQGHHKAHRDALVATIQKLGGKPAAEKSMNDYATALNAGSLKNQGDVLHLAARLERGAANAYLGVIPSFGDKGLAQVAGRLAADEAMHWTVLASALGETLPSKALSFGA
ncbi:ferritin-like domain-containing protein [Dongia deserti]|uniref:ferritin-like domain-containing protein n=1 Tax=Dongia deserti TaxID=2268030 RepID=UPI000E651B18|nr:ferritin-like domain-containing protein [Dongia deserti]